MAHTIFNFGNICRLTWLDQKEISQLEIVGYLGFSNLKEYQDYIDDQLAERIVAQIESDRAYYLGGNNA